MHWAMAHLEEAQTLKEYYYQFAGLQQKLLLAQDSKEIDRLNKQIEYLPADDRSDRHRFCSWLLANSRPRCLVAMLLPIIAIGGHATWFNALPPGSKRRCELESLCRSGSAAVGYR